MQIKSIFLAISAVIILLILLEILGHYITQVFSVSENTKTGVYQGGEVLSTRERGYHSKVFDLPVYYLILHVIGFFTATLYVIPRLDGQILNWTTVIFGVIILYTVFLIRQTTR